MRERDRIKSGIKSLNQQLDARESSLRLAEAQVKGLRLAEAQVKAYSQRIVGLEREVSGVRRENLKLKCRLDAVLYALVLLQGTVKQENDKALAEGKQVTDEMFLAVGVEPPERVVPPAWRKQ